MIVVTVELWSARTGEKTVLGQTTICNVGGTEKRGNYAVRVGRKGQSLEDGHLNPTREGRVEHYPRLGYSVWRLVIRALRSAFPEERG